MGATVMMRDVPQKLALAMMMAFFLIDTSVFGSASGTNLWDSNATNNIIAYQDEELEFQMDSESNRRVLALNGPYKTGPTGKPDSAGCGRVIQGKRYTPCGGPDAASKNNYCKDRRNRDCK
ncbi:hypothetical protein TorRG33x02_342640 [Trema orientale]|uniref:Rapid ALkalinization Factor n=1 Tax=Trema orientale TaxID=63057 RepID=A0A2P5ASF2_TREOI|nr:hypothetical protein TorRG33x02_342640 [Trema orientale]